MSIIINNEIKKSFAFTCTCRKKLLCVTNEKLKGLNSRHKISKFRAFNEIALNEVIEIQKDSFALTSKKEFKIGEKLFSIEEKDWITPSVVSKSDIGKFLNKCEPWLKLAIFLIQEKSNTHSKYKNYLNTLAPHLTSPTYWVSLEDLEFLKGSQIYPITQSYKEFFKLKFKEIEENVFSKNREIFPIEKFNLNSFLWSVGTVRSKVHSPLELDKIALIPYADLVLHARHGNVEWNLNDRNKSKLDVMAIKDIDKGDILKMDYGPDKIENQIALDYGIIDDMNPKHGYKLTLEVPQSDDFLDDKLDVLDVIGLNSRCSFNLIPNLEPSDEMLLFLRLINLKGEDSFHLEALFRNEIRDHLMYPVSEENEKNICESMINGAKEALSSGYNPNLSINTENQKLAQQICLGEKLTLEWVIEWFEKRKSELKKLEYYAERRLKRLGLLDEEGKSTFEDMLDSGIA